MNNNAKRFMYVNPNFQHGLYNRLCTSNGNNNFDLIRHNIRPMQFDQYNNLVSTSDIRPKVHFNPKMLHNLNINKVHINPNVMQSENKFCKINPPKSETIQSLEHQSSLHTKVEKVRKPCHSLVRKKQTPPYHSTPVHKKQSALVHPLLKRILPSVSTKYKVNNISVKKVNMSLNSSIQKLIKNEYTYKKKLNRSLSKSSLPSPSTQINTVFIGGEKYVLQNNKLKKIRVSHQECAGMKLVKQISINGKTFVRKSADIFVQANSKKMKKNNIACPIYKRLGTCKRHNDGKCSYLHDKKLIAICKNFLQGCCILKNCRLSHDIVLEKMPTCKYYLEGCCARDDCPYLHVKVNKNADVCIKFLQGFCDDGANCEKIHTNVCPQFYKFGVCKTLKCLFPHKMLTSKNNKVTVKNRDKHRDNSAMKNVPKITENTDSNENVCRYYSEPVDLNSKDEGANLDDSRASDIEPVTCFSRRPALGSLPSFIAL